jgi:hypothetical protein
MKPFAVFVLVPVDGGYAATTRANGRMGLPGGQVEPGETAFDAVYREAEAEFWMLTDCEYDDETPYKECWEWRSAKVMARKCCWYQLKQPLLGQLKAKNLMRSLHDAEHKLFNAIGLQHDYKCACHYIEEKFPKLKEPA